jgi:hypothetical protein
MGSEPPSIFFAKSSTLLSSVSPCIVSMNNKFSPIVLWLELSQCCKDIITIVLGVKDAPWEVPRSREIPMASMQW